VLQFVFLHPGGSPAPVVGSPAPPAAGGPNQMDTEMERSRARTFKKYLKKIQKNK
jgi:hypothetical protein